MKFLLVCILFSTSVFGQNLDYPELNVTPRASDRITIEARQESDSSSQFWAIQVSSMATFLTSLSASSELSDKAKEDGNEIVPSIGMAVSAGILGISYWYGSHYRPYASSYNKLKAYPRKSKREQLTLERLAEEEINSLKRLGQKLRWVSSFANLSLSIAVAEVVRDESDTSNLSPLSAALAVGSFFVSTHWEDVAQEQEKYKKRIFGPVAFTPTVLFNSFSQKYISGFSLRTTF